MGHAENLERLDEYIVRGKGIVLKSGVTLQPPIVLPSQGRLWLEEYVAGPRNEPTQRKMRRSMLDGVLVSLRALVTLASVAAIGYGEGA